MEDSDKSNESKREYVGDTTVVSRRKTLASLLSLPIATKAIPQRAMASSKSDEESGTGIAASGPITNNDISAIVDNNGEFELTTASGEQLTFPRAGTSGLTVQIDGTNYVLGTPPGTDIDQYRTQDTIFSNNGNSATTRWSLPEGVEVTQRISLAGEAVQFDLTVENTGSQDRDVKVRYLVDYQVGPQDGAPIFVNGNVITSETRFEPPTFDTWQTYDQLPNPSLTGQGTIGTQPDKIEFVAWEDASFSSYTYSGFDSNKDFFTSGSTTSPASDSAGLLYYEPGTVAPGEEEQITTFYGVGSPTQTDISELDTALREFRQATTDLLDTRIETRADAHAELYNEVGEQYRRNLVNYLGGRADIQGVDSSGVDPELEDRLDELTQDFSRSTYESLYRFFDEMFRQVNPSDPLDQMKDVFESYLRGTASGQTNKLEVNGKPIAGPNSVRQSFVSDFSTRQNDALNELRLSSVSEEEVGNLVEFVKDKQRGLRAREQEIRSSTENTISAIKDGDEVKTHAKRITESGASSSSLQPAAAGLALLGGLSIKTGAAVAIKSAGAKIFSAGAAKVAAGFTTIYGGSAALSSLSWSQYTIGYWSLLQAWSGASSSATSGAGTIARELIKTKTLEEFDISPDGIISDFAGIEIDIITDMRDIPVTLVELVLDSAVEAASESDKGVVVEGVRAPNIDPGDVSGGQATETAEVDLRNPMSSESVQPRLVAKGTGIKSTPLTNPFESEVPGVLNVQPEGSGSDLPEIPPGGAETIEIEYIIPTNYVPGRYKLQVTVAPARSSVSGSQSLGSDTFIDAGLPIDASALENLQTGSILRGQSATAQSTVGESVARRSFNLSYGGSDLDLHLRDEAGNHVGVNYQTGEFEEEISGATATGQDGGAGSEGIAVTNPSGTYESEVVAVRTSDQGTDYSVDSFDVSDTDPVINVIPSEVQVSREASGSTTRSVTVEEVAGFNGLMGVGITPSDLVESGGETIASSNVSVSATGFDVSAGSRRTISIDVSVPDSTPPGTYTGQLNVTANGGSQSIGIPLTVEVQPPGVLSPNNPFGDSGNDPVDRQTVINRVVQWNLNGNIDGTSYTRQEIIQFIVNWNLA